MRTKLSILIFLFLAAFAYYCISTYQGLDYYEPEILATHPEGGDFVGSQTCMECHRDIYDTHIQTAHFNTSAITTEENILGSFEPGSNKLMLENVTFEMKKQGEAFYQHTQMQEEEALPIPPQRFDVIVGSGVKGQSYLTWEEEHLFQLQASYYPPLNQWINSPGYPPQLLKRPIQDGCLKCHVTFATNRDFSGQGNHYDKSRMIYGVDCERCHRPGRQHVMYHRENPDDKTAKFMLKLDTLSRQLRLDVCGQCHSGLRSAVIKGNAFSFLPGEPLNEYTRNYYTGVTDAELDVHGNQYGLLTSSQCFQKSTNLDCGTCHDPHKNQRGDTDYFNQKCNGCHQSGTVTCSTALHQRKSMGDNCIGCHMPTTPSKMMKFQLDDEGLETSAQVRTHLIGIYSKAPSGD